MRIPLTRGAYTLLFLIRRELNQNGKLSDKFIERVGKDKAFTLILHGHKSREVLTILSKLIEED